MFTITSTAAYKLNDLLKELSDSEAKCLRLEVRDCQAMLTLDEPRDFDQVFVVGDRKVLVADATTCDECSQVHLDCGSAGNFALVYSGNRFELN
ncbi:hypothetical protein [Symmachiella dynata]|uniref:hypothetical protein n=1 Tax=Symmachiella dynata TaxID=2527995 RepID=UPI00118BEA08|nr:hypothetical protein [Symmachiella dynata]QDT51621.1 hypothetical protein Pan258_57100 [Symmachiella dynata]